MLLLGFEGGGSLNGNGEAADILLYGDLVMENEIRVRWVCGGLDVDVM